MRKSKAIIDLVINFYDTYFYQVYSELFADFYGFMSNPLKVKYNALHTILAKTKFVSGQILFRALSRLLCLQCSSPILIRSCLSFKMLLRRAFTG